MTCATATLDRWLHRSGVDSLTTALPARERGADLRMDTFRTRFFGGNAEPEVATYRPRFGVEFPQIAVPGVKERDFKFFKAPEKQKFGRRRGR